MVFVVLWNSEFIFFQLFSSRRTTSESESLFHDILHQYTDKNSTEKLPCSICGKRFVRTSLRCHLRQHTSERNFKCDQCGISFARKATLASHIVQKHLTPPEDGVASAAVAAATTTTQEKPSADEKQKREFICAMCDRVFLQR